MLALQLGNEEFTRGVSGSVWFRLENTGEEEIEIITAKSNGNASNRGTNHDKKTTHFLASSKESVGNFLPIWKKK
jgi:hypothetical protein